MADYKYVADSCCELPGDFASQHECANVPLTIYVGDDVIIDDETFDQSDFLRKVAACPKYPRSAAPSPYLYMKAFETDAKGIFVSTLSSPLSGSYNSALTARDMYLQEHPEKKIHVFDSRSASGGEAQVLIKAASLADSGMDFDEIVEETERFIREDLKTYFVLEDMEALRKNGRLSRMKTLAVTALNLRPVCASDNGTIIQIGLCRGIEKALKKMVDISFQKLTPDLSGKKTLVITHCNCLERAQRVLKNYLARMKFAQAILMDTAGISSLYAGNGGIIVTIG